MFEIKDKWYDFLVFAFLIFVLSAGSFCPAVRKDSLGEQFENSDAPNETSGIPDGRGIWDVSRYIGLDEIRPGMEGYCLTEYGAAGIEKFNLKVIDVVRDFEAGRDIILVEGTDERFIHTGPVAGCSGSPVYIDGRMAGALAYAWTYSKDPLYGATAIEDMLKVGQGKAEESVNAAPKGVLWTAKNETGPGYVFDYSKPIDFTAIDKAMFDSRESIRHPASGLQQSARGRLTALPCPLITSGLPAEVCEQLSAAVEPFGFMVVPGVSGAMQPAEDEQNGGGNEDAERKLVPGACLAIPLVSGDITIGTYGTVTEVRGDKVYGFGHPYLGYGSIDLPMATGKVHTVISSVVRSSKLVRVVKTVGALTRDEGAGILGTIGAKAQTFPLTIRVDRYNDTEKRVYNCRVANNRLLTPTMLLSAVSGAALYLGDLPPDHTLEYKASIGIEDFEAIKFENVSTGIGLAQIMLEARSAVALLMNNPYKNVRIESIQFDIRIAPKDITSHIWSADLSDSKVKAGDQLEIEVVIESVYAKKRKYKLNLEIPEDLPPGKYELTLCGSRDYEQFLLKAVPYRFIAQSLPDLVKALSDALQVKRDKLYCLLTLPPGGITLEKAELPDLPATKAMILQSAKRPMKVQPYPHWLEKSLETGTVIIDKKVMHITVEQ